MLPGPLLRRPDPLPPDLAARLRGWVRAADVLAAFDDRTVTPRSNA